LFPYGPVAPPRAFLVSLCKNQCFLFFFNPSPLRRSYFKDAPDWKSTFVSPPMEVPLSFRFGNFYDPAPFIVRRRHLNAGSAGRCFSFANIDVSSAWTPGHEPFPELVSWNSSCIFFSRRSFSLSLLFSGHVITEETFPFLFRPRSTLVRIFPVAHGSFVSPNRLLFWHAAPRLCRSPHRRTRYPHRLY